MPAFITAIIHEQPDEDEPRLNALLRRVLELSEVSSEMSEVSSRMDQMSFRVPSETSRMSDLSSEMSEVSSEMSEVSSRMDEMSFSVSSETSEVSSRMDEMSKMSSRMSYLSSEIPETSEVSTRMDEMSKLSSEMSDLSISRLDDPFENLCGSLESYQNKSELAVLRTKIEELLKACQFFLTVINPLWYKCQITQS